MILTTRKELVADFYEAFKVDQPVETRMRIIKEEAREVREAAQALLKELADLQYVVVGAEVSGITELPDDVADDIMRVAHLYDMIPQEILDAAFFRVHESNMSKLGEDGKPILREDGKVLKGPNYATPDLSDLI
jgi:predicted HAD superfamily Cof-like phosphohydrolase